MRKPVEQVGTRTEENESQVGKGSYQHGGESYKEPGRWIGTGGIWSLTIQAHVHRELVIDLRVCAYMCAQTPTRFPSSLH